MRLQGWTIAVSLAGLPFIVPHVVEDFAEGIAQRVGLSTGVGAFLLGVWLAVQMLGLVLLVCGRRAGWIVAFWTSAIWTVVAVADHGPALVAGGFRSGALSVLWVLGLVVSQGAAAALAWQGWRRRSAALTACAAGPIVPDTVLGISSPSEWSAPAEVIGLCVSCGHARRVTSARGSTFWRCALSERDPRFPKYPTLPVLACAGHAPDGEEARSPDARPDRP